MRRLSPVFVLQLALLGAVVLPATVHATCAADPLLRAQDAQAEPPAAAPVAADPQLADAMQVQAGTSEDAASEARAALSALGRLEDADTALSMAAEGAALYENEAVKLDGYAYCSQAVELAEKGEFRESARAASKALHVALQTGNTDLLGKAYRDLAIAFSYAGQLERAEQFATLSLKYPGLDPTQVNGPSRKVLGDVRTRQQRYDEAIALYDQAREQSSARFRPLVDASLANALILSGDVVRARATLDAVPQPADARQRAQLQRTQGRLLLAENKPAEALALYRALADAPADGDEDFYRAWALDGISKSEAALGNEAQAADALDQAISVFDKARSQFRSDEFKMGLFSDLQAVFERAIGMHSKLGQPARAFDISERSRARALLDAVSGRADMPQGETAVALDAATLQTMLRPDEVVVAYHALPDRLVAWVLSNQGVREVKIPVALPRQDLARLNRENEPAIKKAVALLASREVLPLAEAATISALANQRILHKAALPQIITAAKSMGAIGVNVAHSGTVLGILFAPDVSQEKIAGAVMHLRRAFPRLIYMKTARLIAGGCLITGKDR